MSYRGDGRRERRGPQPYRRSRRALVELRGHVVPMRDEETPCMVQLSEGGGTYVLTFSSPDALWQGLYPEHLQPQKQQGTGFQPPVPYIPFSHTIAIVDHQRFLESLPPELRVAVDLHFVRVGEEWRVRWTEVVR